MRACCTRPDHGSRSDTDAELQLVREQSLAAGADAAVVSNHWAKGGAGARDLAEAVIATCEGSSNFKFLYDLELPIEKKIEIISKEIYGADGIELSELAQKQVETYTRQGYGNLPSELCHNLAIGIASDHHSSLHGEDAVLVLS